MDYPHGHHDHRDWPAVCLNLGPTSRMRREEGEEGEGEREGFLVGDEDTI
jgi:hypothetical protein